MIEKPCLLDTDTLSYVLKEQSPAYQISLEYLHQYQEFTISCISYYECLRGYKASGATRRLEHFHGFLILTDVIYLDRAIFETASDIYSTLKKLGTLPGDFDILIAATALVYEQTLVTNNEKHYQPIQAHFPLQVCNWMKGERGFKLRDTQEAEGSEHTDACEQAHELDPKRPG